MIPDRLTRREMLRNAALAAAALALPSSLLACNRKEAIPVGAAKDSADATPQAEDQQRLAAWTAT
ncbi:MAG TPA: hypothetical protein VFZ56_05775, partial [Gemmatimonadaceae bacterium]